MPNRFENPAIYLQSGNPETENTPLLYAPGLLGSRFTVMQPTGRGTPATVSRAKRYQLVKTDSTMAVSPYPGAVAYWADKSQYLTTTVNTNINSVAGVYRGNIDKGNYCCVQITGPAMVKVIDASVAACAAGDLVIGSSTTVGKADRVAAGTAPTNVPLGRIPTPVFKSPAEALVQVDLDVPETP